MDQAGSSHMMTTNAKIERVLFEVAGQPSGKVQFVEYASGRFAILRDEAPVAGFEWPSNQLHRGVTAFREYAAGKPSAALRN